MSVPEFNTTITNRYRNPYLETNRRMTGVWKLLVRWKGSIAKLIYPNITLFLLVYTFLSVLYRFVLFEEDYYRQMFEAVCIYCRRFSNLIPITFITGFYVSQVVTRWWRMVSSLSYPDLVACKLVSGIPGSEHFSRHLRLTIIRYVNLSTILVYRLVSRKVRKRFPDMVSLLQAKLILPHEAERLAKLDDSCPHETSGAPLLWAAHLLHQAKEDKKVAFEFGPYIAIVNGIENIDKSNRSILNFGKTPFPLAYTQVANLCVYLYFGVGLLGRQYLIPPDHLRDNETFPELAGMAFAVDLPFSQHTPDFRVPFFTVVEFICYVGWIKVSQTLLNPYGDDDEDFEINYLIDRNLQVSYLIVDKGNEDLDMAEDPFLEAGISVPEELPYQPSPSRKVSVQLMRSISKGAESSSVISRKRSTVSLAEYRSAQEEGKDSHHLGTILEKQEEPINITL